MLKIEVNPSGQGSHQNLPAVAAAARLRCNTGPRLLPLPTSTLQHSQALLPKGPVSVQNNCFSWRLRSRYLSEGAQGSTGALDAVPSSCAGTIAGSPWTLSSSQGFAPCGLSLLSSPLAPEQCTRAADLDIMCFKPLPGVSCSVRPGIPEEDCQRSS